MATPSSPEPVLLLVAVLWADTVAYGQAEEALKNLWGPLVFEGPDHPFDRTRYYAAEMGEVLFRRLIAFEKLVSPEILAEAKLLCNEIEDRLAGPGGRRVNLDVGILDHNKIVLASVKAAGQKIYLSRGIYADLVGRYAHGRYQPFEWTFPDFKDNRYDADLTAMRAWYLKLRQKPAAG